MSFLEEKIAWAKKNRLASALLILIALYLIIELLVPLAFFSVADNSSGLAAYDRAYAPQTIGDYGEEYISADYMASKGGEYFEDYDEGAYVEVKTGSMRIETKTAVSDSVAIEGFAEHLEGYTENTRKSESDYYLNIYLTLRIPSENFEMFVDTLRERYDVKTFDLDFYRLSTQRELDELELIENTISDYEELRKEAKEMELTEEQIDMLFRITEKELELRRLQKSYESSLESKETQSEYSTITVTLEETKKVQLMPENLGNQLRNKVKYALDDASNSIMDLFTGTLVIFFDAVLFVVKGLIVLIVAMAGYKIALVIYRGYFPAKKKR